MTNMHKLYSEILMLAFNTFLWQPQALNGYQPVLKLEQRCVIHAIRSCASSTKTAKRTRKLCQRKFQITSYQLFSAVDLMYCITESQDAYQLKSAFLFPIHNRKTKQTNQPKKHKKQLSFLFLKSSEEITQIEVNGKLNDKLKMNISYFLASLFPMKRIESQTFL